MIGRKLEAYNSRFQKSNEDYMHQQGWEPDNFPIESSSNTFRIIEIARRFNIVISISKAFELYLKFEQGSTHFNYALYDYFIEDKVLFHYQKNIKYDFENYIEKLFPDTDQDDNDFEWLRFELQSLIGRASQSLVELEIRLSSYDEIVINNLFLKFDNDNLNKQEKDFFVGYYIEMSTYQNVSCLISFIDGSIELLNHHQRRRDFKIAKKSKVNSKGKYIDEDFDEYSYNSLYVDEYKDYVQYFIDILKDLDCANQNEWFGAKYKIKIFYQEMVRLGIMHSFDFLKASYLFKGKFKAIKLKTINSSLNRLDPKEIKKFREEIEKVTLRILAIYNPKLPIFFKK